MVIVGGVSVRGAVTGFVITGGVVTTDPDNSRRFSSASAQTTARSRVTSVLSNRKRMHAQCCRSASGTWAPTPPSSTFTAWGSPYTLADRRRLTSG